MDFLLTKDETFLRENMDLPKRILRRRISETAVPFVRWGYPGDTKNNYCTRYDKNPQYLGVNARRSYGLCLDRRAGVL
jgi:hypothetical protein